MGSSNTDMIIKVARIPRPGETIIGGQFSTAAGGKGANQAVAAARAGGKVTLIARVGRDMFGKQAIEGFVRENIDVGFIVQDETAPSGIASICVDEQGENSIAVASGANANLSRADIDSARDAILSADILMMQLECPLQTVQAAGRLAYDHAVPVILDPAPAQNLSREFLSLISILTPNESEAELLTGIKIDTPKKADMAGQALFDKGVQTILITMGSRGIFVFNKEYRELMPAFKVNPVDTTAAGDVFNGALAVALAEGKSLMDSVKWAQAAAALSVTKPGAQPSIPTRNDIDNF